jgi:hypothetical protein
VKQQKLIHAWRRINVVVLKKQTCLLVAAVVLLSLSITSCTGSGSSAPTYTLSGTLTKTGVADGVFGYVKLVAHGGLGSDAALYWARSSEFLSEAATYSIAAIAEGSYTGYAFIDTNGDAAGDATSMPDEIGDWVTDGGGTL